MKKHHWSAAVHLDWTEFESVDAGRVTGLSHFDLLDRSFLSTFSASFGLTDHFQIGLGFGYYAAEGARRIPHSHGGGSSESAEAEAASTGPESSAAAVARARSARPVRHGGHGHGAPVPAPAQNVETGESAPPETELASFDPDGWTDLWLTAKYRLHQGPAGQFALFGGVKFPVGETRVIDSAGLRVEPASTPGSGAWDFLAGGAYTLAISRQLALDASAQYIVRGEKFNYELGNRLDAGLAVAWQVWGEGASYPQASLVGEASIRHIEKSEEYHLESDDSGGTAIFLSPGFRVAFSPHAAWSAAVQLPVRQDLNGHQVETEFRVSTSFSISF